MIIDATVEYEPTPEQLAEEFCKFYEEGQARFLNHVAHIFNKDKSSLAMQLEYISQTKTLNSDARYLMRQFGEYSFHNYKTKGEEG